MSIAREVLGLIRETGEMGRSEIEPGGAWYEVRQKMENICQQAGVECEVRPFDQYQGPKCSIPSIGELWMGDEDGTWVILTWKGGIQQTYVAMDDEDAVSQLRTISREKRLQPGPMDWEESRKREAKESTSSPMICRECGRKFRKKIGRDTYEVKCPKCGSYDTEPLAYFAEARPKTSEVMESLAKQFLHTMKEDMGISSRPMGDTRKDLVCQDCGLMFSQDPRNGMSWQCPRCNSKDVTEVDVRDEVDSTESLMKEDKSQVDQMIDRGRDLLRQGKYTGSKSDRVGKVIQDLENFGNLSDEEWYEVTITLDDFLGSHSDESLGYKFKIREQDEDEPDGTSWPSSWDQGRSKDDIAKAMGLETAGAFDYALPQDWVNSVTQFVGSELGEWIGPSFVWLYDDQAPNFGRPCSLSYKGNEILSHILMKPELYLGARQYEGEAG